MLQKMSVNQPWKPLDVVIRSSESSRLRQTEQTLSRAPIDSMIIIRHDSLYCLRRQFPTIPSNSQRIEFTNHIHNVEHIMAVAAFTEYILVFPATGYQTAAIQGS